LAQLASRLRITLLEFQAPLQSSTYDSPFNTV
jgi:hypothetical protein